jgi:hypothetical protein
LNDQGVLFRPAAGGAEASAGNYMEVFPKRTLAVVPAALSGPQRLTVRRRNRPTQPEPAEFTYSTVLEPA